jgi:hypothetical protein
MINSINTGGRWLTVTGGGSGVGVSKSYNSNTFMAGDMRYDLDAQCIKVFDGQTWQMLFGGSATIDLSYEAQALLDWAQRKKNEEMLLEKQAQENPAIKDLVDQIKMKQDQIKMVQVLLNSPGDNAIKPSMIP